MISSRSLSPVLGALALFAAAPAQEPAQRDEAALVRQHLAVVRDRRLTLEEKLPAMDALLELGTEGPRQLAARIASDGKALRKDNRKAAERLLLDFDRRAAAISKERLDRTAEREIDELRELVLERARDPQLSKETIVAESDPALERLAELLAVEVSQVAEADDDWTAARAELSAALADEALLAAYSARCVARLEALDGGERLARRVEVPEDPSGEEARIEAELALRSLLATPMSPGDRRALLENGALAGALDAEELAGVRETNRVRVLLGLNALRIDEKLCEAARDHSKDMRELGFFSHESPVEGKRTFGERAARAGTSASAENIAWGQATGHAAILGWWHSPGHHRNLLGGHGRVGLGRSEEHWTQLFGG